MRRKLIFTLFALIVLGSLVLTGQALAEEKSQFFGILIYRTGPYAPGGSGFGSGWEDFMQLRNLQGGVNGIKYAWEECETAYNTARGIECYERLKDKGTRSRSKPFKFELHVMPGVYHNSTAGARRAIELLFPIKEENDK